MFRIDFRATHWTLPTVLACSLLGAAPPSRAQFGGLGKIIKKAQDIRNSKQGQEVKKGIQALTPLTLDQEKDVGREVAAKLIGFYHLYNDPGLTRYVNLVGATVAAQSPRQDIQYHFAILDSNEINAFSAPGGYIFVTRGALALCDDESELAGVLAHEVAHVADKHIVHVIENDKKTRTGKEVASDYAQGSPLLDKLANTGIKALTQGLAPKDEYEADHDGVEFAQAAGYPADGLERFLTKLNQATDQGAHSFWTRTHPPVADRNACIQQLIASNNWQSTDRPKLDDRFAQETAVLKAKPQT
jgi:predicted Zn-dependent protease